MAKVTYDTPPPVGRTYTITMSEAELIDLMKWLGQRPVGGGAGSLFRTYDCLSDALRAAGVEFTDYYIGSDYDVTVTPRGL